MDWQIKWKKTQRDRVDFSKQDLFAVGTEGRAGRWEQTGMMDSDKAQFLTLFAHHLYEGKSTREAFDETEKKVAEFAAKQAAKKGA